MTGYKFIADWPVYGQETRCAIWSISMPPATTKFEHVELPDVIAELFRHDAKSIKNARRPLHTVITLPDDPSTVLDTNRKIC